MNIVFRGESLSVRQRMLPPGKFRLNDIVVGPAGILLEVATVQTDCPVWSKFNNNARQCSVVFMTEDNAILPVPGISGEFIVYRR